MPTNFKNTNSNLKKTAMSKPMVAEMVKKGEIGKSNRGSSKNGDFANRATREEIIESVSADKQPQSKSSSFKNPILATDLPKMNFAGQNNSGGKDLPKLKKKSLLGYVVGGLLLVLLLVGGVAGFYLSGQDQDVRQQADECSAWSVTCCNNSSISESSCDVQASFKTVHGDANGQARWNIEACNTVSSQPSGNCQNNDNNDSGNQNECDPDTYGTAYSTAPGGTCCGGGTTECVGTGTCNAAIGKLGTCAGTPLGEDQCMDSGGNNVNPGACDIRPGGQLQVCRDGYWSDREEGECGEDTEGAYCSDSRVEFCENLGRVCLSDSSGGECAATATIPYCSHDTIVNCQSMDGALCTPNLNGGECEAGTGGIDDNDDDEETSACAANRCSETRMTNDGTTMCYNIGSCVAGLGQLGCDDDKRPMTKNPGGACGYNCVAPSSCPDANGVSLKPEWGTCSSGCCIVTGEGGKSVAEGGGGCYKVIQSCVDGKVPCNQEGTTTNANCIDPNYCGSQQIDIRCSNGDQTIAYTVSANACEDIPEEKEEPDSYFCNSDCDNPSQCQDTNLGGNPNFTCSTAQGNKCRLTANPTSASCQPAVGPMCLNVTMRDAQTNAQITTDPTFGDSVNFMCANVAGADHYIFRVIEPDSTIIALGATGLVSENYTINQSGKFYAQCQICTGTSASTCHSFENPMTP